VCGNGHETLHQQVGARVQRNGIRVERLEWGKFRKRSRIPGGEPKRRGTVHRREPFDPSREENRKTEITRRYVRRRKNELDRVRNEPGLLEPGTEQIGGRASALSLSE